LDITKFSKIRSKETREYVAAVLTYALIYQRRLGGKKSFDG
jgi:soluble lytic murein transglycosylase-like protein